MFHERYPEQLLENVLLPADHYRPFAAASDRAWWGQLAEPLRRLFVERGEARLGFAWPALPAARYMDFVKNGNRSRYEELYFERRTALAELVVAECAEGAGRFVEQIVNGLWALCEESYWVLPAHMSLSKASAGYALPDVDDQVIDLFSAETAALVACADYALREQLDAECPMIRRRLRREMERRMFTPFMERTDFWWMGFGSRGVNNWNPWILSNVIGSFLLLEEQLARRAQAIAKSLRSLEAFTDMYGKDGGCDEGPGYWGRAGGSMFDCLELLYTASDGRISFYDEPLVKEIGRYISRVHISGEYFVNFADGDARLRISDDLVYRFGQRIGDEAMCALGAYAFRQHGGTKPNYMSLLRLLPGLDVYDELMRHDGIPHYMRDVWLEDIQLFAARERGGSDQGLYLAAKGGHNAESHNHNDVGHFIVYAGGKPMIIDIGVETYTSRTFSSRRYEIWTMQSAYHALPTVRGVQQAAGKQYRASAVNCAADDERAELSMNIAAAYPPEAGIGHWHRTCRLNRGVTAAASIEIVDRFALNEPTAELTLSLMTLREPLIREDEGHFLLDDGSGVRLRVVFDAAKLTAASERIAVEDRRLRSIWGEQVYRVLLRPRAAVREDEWKLTIAQF
ncbi:heparinase II/III domain-containing protein [Paenibacillus solanacearum]|nr:heparinase II/III family protein [Paenibacillus solanacearum]